MATSPDIYTKRLCITSFSERHLTQRYVDWLNDPELMRYSEQRHRSHTLASCRAYWGSFENTPNYFWAIEETENALGHIGNINAYVDPNNRVSDLGILIGEKKAANQKYGHEAWANVCRFLFEKCGIRKITAGTAATNTPMRKLMTSAGMVEDGTRKKHFLMDGQEVNIIYNAVFKHAWHPDRVL